MRHHLRTALIACACAALLASGCQLIVDPDHLGDDPPGGDAGDAGAGMDAFFDADMRCSGVAPPLIGYAGIEATGQAPGLVASGMYVIDTDEPSLRDANGNLIATMEHVSVGPDDTVALLAVDTFTLPQDAIVRAHGTPPLYIASAESMLVYGTIDVSSKSGSPPGAGRGQAVDCDPHQGTGEDGETLIVGGGGGGFGSNGGSGRVTSNNGGNAAPPASRPPTVLRGGCSGGAGGGAGSAPGGNGGGAVMLYACDYMLFMGSTVDASGAGGSAGISGGGGAGGGSGGFIGYEAPIVNFMDTTFLANGGGGGGGNGPGGGEAGSDGSTGGAGGMNGAAAGSGGVGAENQGQDQPSAGGNGSGGTGNGGGGGGAGQIYGITPTN